MSLAPPTGALSDRGRENPPALVPPAPSLQGPRSQGFAATAQAPGGRVAEDGARGRRALRCPATAPQRGRRVQVVRQRLAHPCTVGEKRLTDSLTNHDISGTIKPTDLKFRSCDRRLCGNNHHTCKDTCATLNYCVVPSWITRRPLTSRETLFPPLAGCNEMLKGVGLLIPEQREGEPEKGALNLQSQQFLDGATMFRGELDDSEQRLDLVLSVMDYMRNSRTSNTLLERHDRLEMFVQRLKAIKVVFETSSAFLRLAKTEVGGIHGHVTAIQIKQIYDEFQEQLVTFDKCPYDVLEPDAQVTNGLFISLSELLHKIQYSTKKTPTKQQRLFRFLKFPWVPIFVAFIEGGLRCRPRHLTEVQISEVRHQYLSSRNYT
ncbi:dynein beta chain, ciliary [Trichonephila clavipes]|nr:dynein beta chain, ciliary [Trichonephila clavipes]